MNGLRMLGLVENRWKNRSDIVAETDALLCRRIYWLTVHSGRIEKMLSNYHSIILSVYQINQSINRKMYYIVVILHASSIRTHSDFLGSRVAYHLVDSKFWLLNQVPVKYTQVYVSKYYFSEFTNYYICFQGKQINNKAKLDLSTSCCSGKSLNYFVII